VCRQRLAEIAGDTQLELAGTGRGVESDVDRIREWAGRTATGDLAELDPSPVAGAIAAVTVGSGECPGARRCPEGEACFAERARAAAAEAGVVVVNQHLLGLDVVAEGAVLPEHDVVVVDEAHQLEDVMSSAAGFEITEGRIAAFTRT